MDHGDYSLGEFTAYLRQRMDGHEALFKAHGRESDRGYAEAFRQALDALFDKTYGDFGEAQAHRLPDPERDTT